MAGATLLVEVLPEPDEDPAELAEVTRRLRAELLTLDVEAVHPVDASPAAEPAADAKGVRTVFGSLVVWLGKLSIPRIVTKLHDWRQRNRGREVEICVDGERLRLTAATAEQQEKIVEVFLDRLRSAG